MTPKDLRSVESKYAHPETTRRLEAEIKSRDLLLFSCIDHAAGAAAAGISLRATTVLIFGNAKTGTALMQEDQRIGINLPLKALVWQDAGGKTWISYIDPAYLVVQDSLSGQTERVAAKMREGIEALVNAAAGN